MEIELKLRVGSNSCTIKRDVAKGELHQVLEIFSTALQANGIVLENEDEEFFPMVNQTDDIN